jgi:trk system potassium uptake protein TrkH
MKAIIANLGFVLQTSGLITLFAIPVGLIYNEQLPLIALFMTAAVFLGSGFLLNALCQRKDLDFKSSCILISLTFLLLGIIGSIPYLYTNTFADTALTSRIVNSIFESVSGFTTTGLSMVLDPESLPRSIIFYRGLTQWIGGIGIVFIVLVFLTSSETLSGIGKAISLGKITSTIKKSYISIFLIYSAFTLLFVAILYAAGLRDLVNNFSLVFSTVSTGGFSPVNNFSSLDTFPVNVILAILMIIGAMSFTVHYKLFTGKFRRFINVEAIILIAIILICSVIYFLLTGYGIFTAFFQIASASSTTGYSFGDLASLAINAKMILFVLMFIGGSSYSTAGGVKVISIVMFFKSIPWILKGAISGNLSSLTFEDQEVEHLEILSYMLVIILTILIILACAFIFTFFDFSLVDSVFELTSALSNTGLSVGITGLSLPIILKLILVLVMIIGRIGIITLFVALSARWIRQPKPVNSNIPKSVDTYGTP